MLNDARFVLAALTVLLAACAPAVSLDSSADAGAFPVDPACIEQSSGFDCHAHFAMATEDGAPVGNGATVHVDASAVKPGSSTDVILTIANHASSSWAADLVIQSVSLDYDPASPIEDSGPAFTCLAGPSAGKFVSCAAMDGKWDKVVPESLVDAARHRVAALPLRIRYTRYDDLHRTAKLHIKLASSLDWNNDAEYITKFTTVLGTPAAVVAPDELTWPYTPPGKKSARDFAIVNTGDAPLVIESLTLSGSDAFTMSMGDDIATPVSAPEPPLLVMPGQQLKITVLFTPMDDKAHTATIKLVTNDPAHTGGMTVNLHAAPAGP